MKTCAILLLTILISIGSWAQQSPYYEQKDGHLKLTLAGASHLAKLPLKCMQHAYPYKTGIVYSNEDMIQEPKVYHPAFYGCFDWHSSVHGHWMLVRLMRMFPQLPEAAEIKQKLAENLSAAHIQKELELFHHAENKGFERIYGWSWLLQLQMELQQWEDPLGLELAKNVAPLAEHFSKAYQQFLERIAYPIRVGEHSNLAFGLRLAWDYAAFHKDEKLQNSIRSAAMRFYSKDVNGPITWEPGGYDFLSPCLEEADLMWRILPSAEYKKWIQKFLPGLYKKQITLLQIAQVSDRTDGKLVHLDGLNLSRAWCLYGIAQHSGKNKESIRQLANEHLLAAIPNVASGDYAGEHWLASFAVYALSVEF
jgi:hypothetical protein